MVVTKKVSSADALHRLHQLSFSVPEEVQVRTIDGARTADAKSPLGFYTLDYSLPVEIVTDSPAILAELEAWA